VVQDSDVVIFSVKPQVGIISIKFLVIGIKAKFRHL